MHYHLETPKPRAETFCKLHAVVEGCLMVTFPLAVTLPLHHARTQLTFVSMVDTTKTLTCHVLNVPFESCSEGFPGQKNTPEVQVSRQYYKLYEFIASCNIIKTN